MTKDEYIAEMGKKLEEDCLQLVTQGEFYFDNTLSRQIEDTCPEIFKGTPVLPFVLLVARKIFVMAVDWAYWKYIENMVEVIDKKDKK